MSEQTKPNLQTMLTTAPRLRVRRPSPTTAEFTVTTLPPSTVPLLLLRALLLALRLVLAAATLLLLHGRVPNDTIRLRARGLTTVYAAYTRSPTAAAFTTLAGAVPLWALLPGCLAALYVLSLRVHSHESLLVLRGLGVQTRESPATYLAGQATRFIPTEKIRDVLVNEAFRGFEVRYYLVVVVEDEDDVVVVFPGLLPRRRIVETVWRGVRECLYEEGSHAKPDS